MALGYNPRSTINWKGTGPSTRMGVFALLRKEFLDLKNELKKKKPELSPEQEVLLDMLNGKLTARVHGHKTDDIYRFLNFAYEFGIKFNIEHAADVNNVEVFKAIKSQGGVVNYGPLDSFAYKTELRHENWRNIKYLLQSGVKFGLMSDNPVIKQSSLFLTLRHFIRLGLSKENAISIITKQNAEILGLSDLGRIAEGYKASMLLWNGDPFSLTSWPKMVIAEGKLVYEE